MGRITTFRNIFGFLIGPCALPILMAIAMIASPGGVFAGTTNSTLTNFYDNFETYTNGTPLIYGTNGWYGSSSNIIVQINTVRTGTNAAMIPVDCTLSNRFETNAPSTNIWLQMDLRAVFYDGTNPPIVDTNMAAMFYINSNGYFMVHNGPATNPSPTNSLSWVVATNNVQISTNGTNWVRINIYEDFSQINWDLYSDGVLVTNTIGFINTNLTNFAGFDIYNGSMTSYLDNVSVAAMNTNQFPVIVIPSALSTNVFAGKTAGGKTFKVRNVWVTDVDYKVQTNQTWVTASPVVGPVLAYETNTVTLTFADTENWAAGAYNATVSVVATNTDDGEYDTQTVAVVINIMNMQVAPTSLSNSSYVGLTPTSQSFQVINAGAGSFNYTGAITNDWILSCTPSNGTVEAFATNLITVTYSNSITNWAVGATSNTTITIASTNGGGATQTVSVALNVVMRDQTITFPAISDQITTNTVGLSATASSSLTVSFAVESGPGEIPVLTNLTFTNSGSVSITASQAGDAQYNPAPNVTNTFNVTKAIAAVTLNNLNQTYDGSAMTVTATTVPAGQTVDITYDGNSWAPTNVGSYAVSGTVNEPMYQGFQVGTLVVTNKALSLVGMTASNKVYDGNTTAIISSYGTTNGIVGSDDVAVDYSGASAAFDTANVGVGKTVTLSSLALSGTAATNYSITNQTTTADITIVTNHTITFPAIPAQPLTNVSLTLSASASSALTVTFTNISGSGTIVGDVITFNSAGENIVVASQTGNVNYAAAVSVTNTFPVYGFSPTTNDIPWSDNFENYFNLEPLINGTNGWYGSATDIIVQDSFFFSGAKAAKIPVDCTLSNRFKTNAPSTNICLQMDVLPSFYDSTNPPVVDTNAAWMFYINTGGYFVVHNGPTTNATASTNWVTLTNTPVVSNAWLRVLLYQDYANTNCSLYVNHVLLTNNIGFINTNITNFAGFDLYSGSSTTYMDNVSVIATTTPPLDLEVEAVPNQLINSVMVGMTPSPVNQYFDVTNSGPAVDYVVEIADKTWLSCFPISGPLAANFSTPFQLTYSNIPSSWAVGVSNQIVWITTTNWGGTQSIAAVNVTLNIMDLQVTPLYLTNWAWVGDIPTSQTFIVQNAGGGSFTYTTQTGAFWIACSSNGGTAGSNDLTLTYANTAGWAAGTSNTTVTIASSDGGGASQIVNVTLNVSNVQASMSVSPSVLSNVVWVGGTPTNNRTFEVRNSGGIPLNFTATDTNNCPWITSVTVSPGEVPANGTNTITLAYGSTEGWAAGASSNTSIKVVSTNGSGATQFVSVVLSVLGISNMFEVVPSSLTNGVVVESTPVPQEFEVRNLSDANFTYGVATTVTWLTSSTTGGLLTARGTSAVTLTYGITTGWTPGTSNGAVTVTASDGGGATNTVDVTLYIYRSGITNTIPFYDDFEQYTNLTPLVGGINGWYGSSAGIMVQQSVKWAGLQATKIPVDCTLSNPFVPASPTNVWIQMDLRPSLVDYAMVDTNQAGMFYINTNGEFVVHNGPTTNATASTNWVTLTNGVINTNGTTWVRIGIYEDFTRKTWDLYTNGVLLTNGLGFINTNLTNFAGFDVCNGVATSYLDNVLVEAPGTVLVNPTDLTNSVMKGLTESNYFTLTAQTGTWTFVNTTSDAWLAVSPVAGSVAAAGTNVVVWCDAGTNSVGSYTGAVYVSAINSNGLLQTQTVAVTMAVMDLQVTPNLTNQVWIGATPAPQTFEVWNAGAGGFQYETQTGDFWIACSSNIGTLGAYSTNVLTLTYAPTAGWVAGTSNTSVKVWSTNGGGATQTMIVTLYVNGLQTNVSVSPTNLTNSVMAGLTPTNQQSFTLTNAGDGSFNYTVTNTDWLAATSTNGTLTSHSNVVIDVKYDSTTTAALIPGSYTNTIAVASTNGTGSTNYVYVVLNVMGMDVTPPTFSNTVMVGWAPAPQTGQVINLGPAAFDYTVMVTNNWLSCALTSAAVNAYSTNNFVVTYSNTVGWTTDTTSNTTISITSADGGGTNRTVDVALTVLGRATNFYVSTNGLSIGPYTNWATAATNIQDAVNAAISNGDHVLVSNGVFTLTNQVSVTNGIFIEGVYSNINTFINGNYPVTTNRCFSVASNAIVQGFTISNGCAEFGGGVYLTAGATLRDCEILRNRVTASVFVGFGGGGIFADSFSTVTNCVIAGNTSAELAGGLLLDSGSTAFNCQISNNAATNDGGGIVVWDGSAIWYSTITGNRASAAGAQGGGVWLGENVGDTSTVWNCTLVNNSADIGGGLAAASGRARNCLIHLNSAGILGAGIYMADSSDPTIQNCTISSNSPSYGVYSHTSASGYFDNCVIVSNAIALNSANVAFTNNCVESTNGLPGSGNITNDPAFMDFAGGNYRLSAGSPCLNTGTNQAWMTNAVDLDGNPRIMGPSVDMGAYENPMSWTVIPGALTNQVMAGRTPTNQDFAIINYGSNTLYYTVTTNAPWVMASSNSGTLGAYETNALVVSYGVTTGWMPGTSNAAVNVVVTNDVSLLYPPQTQAVDVVMNVMQMQAAPAHLTNNVMKGLASSQTFDVANLGNGLLAYTISTNTYGWVSVDPVGGVLTNAFTNTITVTYATNLPYGLTTGLLTVASSSGGGATQYVALTVNVMDLQAIPGGLTNVVLVGYTPTNQSFTLVNPGTAPLTYTLATNATWVSCSDPAGGALTGPGTNTITVIYGPTTNWTPGTISNAIVTIVSTSGGGATQTVAIVMNVTGLLPPSGVTATKGAYSDKVRVTWDVVTNATGYQVWRNTANITATATNLGAIATTLYDDTTAVPEVTYYYWVKSTNSLGVSAFSTPDTGYCNLYAPVGLTASKGTHTDKVALSWTASVGAVGYEIWRNTSSDTSTALKISSPDVTGTSYADTDATNAVLYTYWAKTKGASGVASAFSASDTGWRGLLSPSVSASKGLPREVSVTWSVSAGATSYELWKNTVNESSSATLLASGSATLYRDMAVIPGSHYYYWVKALCAQGDSGLGTSSEGWCGAAKWDFNGDGRAEAWYYHEGDGRWYVMMTTNMLSTLDLGGAGWDAVPADYDGDGKTDIAVYNRGDPSTGSGLGGTWQFMLSGNGYELVTAPNFGGAGYAAAVGDYDGDGIADPAIYAQASGTWQAALSGNGYQAEGGSGFGSPGYQAVPADYDGDGKTDPAIYEEASGNWLMALSGNDYNVSYVLEFGLSGFAPVPGEYDGMGYAQIAVYHEASGNWYIRTGPGPGEYTTVNLGQPGYLPMPADYDGDRYEDESVFYRDRYDGIWYQLRSTEGSKMISGRMSRP